MKNLYIRIVFISLLGAILSMPLAAQGRDGAGARGARQGARGEAAQGRGTRGERGSANETAEQRKALQAKQKAAIDQENASFKQTIQSIQSKAGNSKDSNARTLARQEGDSARRNHQAAIEKIRAETAAAIAALRK